MPRQRALALALLGGGLLVAAALLFGPWWDTAHGENPLTRPSGPDYAAVLRLSLPTLGVAVLVGLVVVASRRDRGTPH
ncbi:MAG: hypothetical protein DI571_11060 [Arsenicicoccus sp.]|uniref:hypothetical protein n=1 Tax=Serinicoccus profundi TaxID=1078471 RepID=UPI000255F8EB|nr:hypothetical protein [Serinicoccus profundi]PZU42609.1 MAG: hypothetical protein DI571_11060 [Arsenicicoccus sp.]